MPQVTLTQADEVERYEVEAATGRMFIVERRGVLTDSAGNVIAAGTKHRRPIEPDADVGAEDKELRDIAKLVRTPARLARYEKVKAGLPDAVPKR